MVLLRERVTRRGIGAVAPCLPSPAKAPPAGPGWIHEIKHDGFRIMARRDAAGVRLVTRKGNDFTHRFPQIAEAVAALPVRTCLIDGEAIVCDENGLAVFDLTRGHGRLAHAVQHCAFDLLELDGEDLRRQPIEERKRRLANLLRTAPSSIVLNQHFDGDGAIVYKLACGLGCEGIVSKRLGSPYKSGPARIGSRSKILQRPRSRARRRRIGCEAAGAARGLLGRNLASIRSSQAFRNRLAYH